MSVLNPSYIYTPRQWGIVRSLAIGYRATALYAWRDSRMNKNTWSDVKFGAQPQ